MARPNILVTGMHKTGTSLLMKIMHELTGSDYLTDADLGGHPTNYPTYESWTMNEYARSVKPAVQDLDGLNKAMASVKGDDGYIWKCNRLINFPYVWSRLLKRMDSPPDLCVVVYRDISERSKYCKNDSDVRVMKSGYDNLVKTIQALPCILVSSKRLKTDFNETKKIAQALGLDDAHTRAKKATAMSVTKGLDEGDPMPELRGYESYRALELVHGI